MNKLIVAAALVTAFVSPAFAQADANMMVRPVVAPPASHVAPGALRSNARATAPIAGAVVMQDGSIAADPDPNIRFQLNREAEEGVW
jgi:hypothetical protein